MTIDEAVAVLTRFEGGHHRNLSAARHNAMKLGIEALIEVKRLQRMDDEYKHFTLPGETEK